MCTNLYDPASGTVYTPNTNAYRKIGEQAVPEGLQSGNDGDIIRENRANPNHDPKNGRFTSGKSTLSKKSVIKTKYSPSPQRNNPLIKLGAKKYGKLCGTLNTKYPNLQKGEIRTVYSAKEIYTVKADGYGGFKTLSVKKLK